jgi:hypothetical protein
MEKTRMSKYLASIAALTLLGTAACSVPASAAERHAGIATVQSHELSSQRRYGRHGRFYARHYRGGPRYYGGPAYGYYGNPYPYYAPPLVSFGVGPFGFRAF